MAEHWLAICWAVHCVALIEMFGLGQTNMLYGLGFECLVSCWDYFIENIINPQDFELCSTHD